MVSDFFVDSSTNNVLSSMFMLAGIPTIIRPFFGDQFFWADRVEALGVGTGVRKLTVDNLAEALVAATTDEKQITRAKVIGEAIRSVRLPSYVSRVTVLTTVVYRKMAWLRPSRPSTVTSTKS